jgi:hypothetical protein
VRNHIAAHGAGVAERGRMRWLVLVGFAAAFGGCIWWELPSHSHGDPITYDSGLPFVHCGQVITTGAGCEYGVDTLCEYTAEGYDAGTALPIIHCSCRSTDQWSCYEQHYPTCAAGVSGGVACMVGDVTCEYEIEADAGPYGSYTCTCTDGTWQCVLPP